MFIHLYGNILVFCDFMGIPHAFQVPAYGLFAYIILGGELFQSLLALYIVTYNLGFVAPDTTIKTTVTVLAFITLGTPSQAVPDNIFRSTEKAFFNHISNYLRKGNKINRLHTIYHHKCPTCRKVYIGVGKTVKRALPLPIIKGIKTLDLTLTPSLDFARDMFLMSPISEEWASSTWCFSKRPTSKTAMSPIAVTSQVSN